MTSNTKFSFYTLAVFSSPYQNQYFGILHQQINVALAQKYQGELSYYSYHKYHFPSDFCVVIKLGFYFLLSLIFHHSELFPLYPVSIYLTFLRIIYVLMSLIYYSMPQYHFFVCFYKACIVIALSAFVQLVNWASNCLQGWYLITNSIYYNKYNNYICCQLLNQIFEMSHSIKAQITVISVQKKKIIPKGACIVEEVSKYEYLSYLINLPDFYQYVLPVKYSFCEFVVKVQKNEKQERQKYHLYYDAEQKYLMSAKKEKNNIGCNYSICTQKNPSKDQGFIAKLRGNFRSNQFNLYDNGKNPDKNVQPKRMQLCFIKFTDKSLWKDDPNNIVMTIPKPMLILSSIKNIPQSQNDQQKQQQSILAQRNQVSPKKYQPKKIIPEHSRSNLLQQLNQKNSKQVQVIKNKKPQFNAKKNQYELNFKGLIEQASSLNYILHTSAGMACLVSGKRTENTYSIYIGFPMTILQGFAFFLANLENKSS